VPPVLRGWCRAPACTVRQRSSLRLSQGDPPGLTWVCWFGSTSSRASITKDLLGRQPFQYAQRALVGIYERAVRKRASVCRCLLSSPTAIRRQRHARTEKSPYQHRRKPVAIQVSTVLLAPRIASSTKACSRRYPRQVWSAIGWKTKPKWSVQILVAPECGRFPRLVRGSQRQLPMRGPANERHARQARVSNGPIGLTQIT
jgi:hypothetical protein